MPKGARCSLKPCRRSPRLHPKKWFSCRRELLLQGFSVHRAAFGMPFCCAVLLFGLFVSADTLSFRRKCCNPRLERQAFQESAPFGSQLQDLDISVGLPLATRRGCRASRLHENHFFAGPPLSRPFFTLGPQGSPSDPKGIPREAQVEAKGGPMEPKVGPSGSQRAPKGMPKGSRRRQVCSKVEPRCILCFPCLLLFILHALLAFSC